MQKIYFYSVSGRHMYVCVCVNSGEGSADSLKCPQSFAGLPEVETHFESLSVGPVVLP